MRLALAIVLTLCCSAAQAALVVQPPIEASLSTHHVVAHLRHIARVDAHRLRFEHVNVLWGDGAGEIVLRLPQRVMTTVEPDSEWIVVYTYRVTHPVFRHSFEDRNNPAVTLLPGVGMAMFRRTDALISLFSIHRVESDLPSQATLELLLDLLQQSTDARAQQVAAMELRMHSELLRDIDRRRKRVLAAIVRRESLPLRSHEMVISAVLELPAPQRPQWLRRSCRSSIDEAGTDLDLGSYRPLLLITCTRALTHRPTRQDIARLGRLLHSNAPGVAKAALLALREADPAQAVVQARSALAQETIHAETRRNLQSWLDGDPQQ